MVMESLRIVLGLYSTSVLMDSISTQIPVQHSLGKHAELRGKISDLKNKLEMDSIEPDDLIDLKRVI